MKSIKKKIPVLTFGLTLSILSSSYAAGLEKNNLPGDSKESAITKLVINADVNIVLIDDGDKPVSMIGDAVFMDQVSFKQTGSTLTVNARKNRNWKTKGVLYIPAASLTSIQVNNDAYVKSAGSLVIPKLDILINGNCKVAVFTWGEVNLLQNDAYEVDYKVRRIPLPVPLAWERTDRELPLAC